MIALKMTKLRGQRQSLIEAISGNCMAARCAGPRLSPSHERGEARLKLDLFETGQARTAPDGLTRSGPDPYQTKGRNDCSPNGPGQAGTPRWTVRWTGRFKQNPVARDGQVGGALMSGLD